MSAYAIETYHTALAAKTQHLTQQLSPFDAPPLAVFPSPPQHYRMRAEFRLWHDGDDLYHVMFDPVTKARQRIDTFPAASAAINRLMPRLLAALQAHPDCRHRLFEIDYLSTQHGEVLVSLLYHRRLDALWQTAAEAIQTELRAEGFNVHLLGRAHKQKIVLSQDFVIESLTVDSDTLHYQHVENSFTQPNAKVNEAMLSWARQVTAGSSGDLLELYCGNGNFSLALAKNFRTVIGTEISKPSVASAQVNLALNGISNVHILRMSAEEFTQALRGERQFQRLAAVDLTQLACHTVSVDPPRAGLDLSTLQQLQQYDHIVYISCNPATLVENLQQLHTTHRIAHAALFDQFPWTHHAEAGVYLTRR